MAESLQKDKIYVYYMVDQEGPCQIGAWPATWDTFIKRKNLTNVVISGHPRLYNNYLGQGLSFGSENMICVIISDLLDQAKNVLKCLAVDKELALKTFETETESVIKSAAKGIVPVIHSFRKWAHNISKIPLKASVEETPKVCIFGGGVLSLMHQQLCDYFCNEGIIPKVVDFSEWIIYVESEAMLRLSFKKGYMGIEKKYRIIPYFMAFLNPRNNFKELYLGVSSRITGITQLNMQKYFLRIARKSGLIYDSFVSFFDMIREGNKYVPYDAFCEAIVTIGRYLCSLKAGIFDGYVHAAVFNCQPSIDAQAILKSLSIRSDAPFISLDFENHVLTSYHMRLLEAVAVKAKYGRQVRNNSGAERVS
jgi:predicted nucleotide-binding protein (sugar kinase/HSP70/actin superfamily)